MSLRTTRAFYCQPETTGLYALYEVDETLGFALTPATHVKGLFPLGGITVAIGIAFLALAGFDFLFGIMKVLPLVFLAAAVLGLLTLLGLWISHNLHYEGSQPPSKAARENEAPDNVISIFQRY